MRIGSLFTGVGGLDLAVGGQLVWYAERDKAASKVLAHWCPGVPNLGDVSTIDYSKVEPVDGLVMGGWPCQPFSSAGKQLGTDDPRYLWPEVTRALRALRPSYAWMEQVADVLRFPGVFDAVLRDLAEVGLDARWTCLRASDVGAPHRRERLFLTAYRPDFDGEEPQRIGSVQGRDGTEPGTARGVGATPAYRPSDARGKLNENGSITSHPRSVGQRSSAQQNLGAVQPEQSTSRRPHPDRRGDAPPHSNGLGINGGGHSGDGGPNLRTAIADAQHARSVHATSGLPVIEPSAVDWGPYSTAIERWERVMGPAPPPLINGQLSPRFVEWMVGLPGGWVTAVLPKRSPALRCLGNIAVPQQARAAFDILESM